MNQTTKDMKSLVPNIYANVMGALVKCRSSLGRLSVITRWSVRTAAIVFCLLTLGVGQMWGGYTIQNQVRIYFDNSASNWSQSYRYLAIGWQSGSSAGGYSLFNMSAITNTKLLVYQRPSDYGNAYDICLFAATSSWGDSGGTYDNMKSWGANITQRYTLTSNLLYQASYVIKPSATGSTSSPASVTFSNVGTGSSSYTGLNSTQTVQRALSTDGGSTYSASTVNTGTVKISSYYLSAYNVASSTGDKTIASGSSSNSCSAARTAMVTCTASSTATGYTFVGWYEGSTQKSTNTTYTYSCTGTAKTITARYKVNQYAVSYGVNSSTRWGTIKLNSGSAVSTTSSSTLNHGTSLSFTASPNSGYQVEGWYSDAACTAGNRLQSGGITYNAGTLTAAKTVYVKFAEITYTVSFANDGHGSTSPSSNQSVGQATGVAVNATPNSGFRFSNWEITSGSGSFASAATTASNTFYPTAASTIKANFSETALALVVQTGTKTGNTRNNPLYLGDYVKLQANVSDLPAVSYTVTFYNNAETSIGTATATSPTSAKLTTSAAWSDYSTQTPTFKAKITGGAGGYRSSTFATTTLYIATPTISTLQFYNPSTNALLSPASIVLGSSIRISGLCDSIKQTNTTIQVIVTGPSPSNSYTYSTNDARGAALNYLFTCTPEATGTYNVTVNLKHNNVTVATRNSSFKVTERTHTVAVAVAAGQSSWGAVSPTSVTAGEENFNTTITATPATTLGYAFDKWTYDSGITLKNAATNASQQIKANADDLTLTANFKTTTRLKNIFITGDLNNWATSGNAWCFEVPAGTLDNNSLVTLTVNIDKDDYYSAGYKMGFNIYRSDWNSKWWRNSTNNAKMDAHNCSGWNVNTEANSGKTYLDLNVSGDYTFTLENIGAANTQALSVTYPDKSFIEGDFATAWNEDAYPLVEDGNIQSVTIPITSCRNVEFRLVSHGKLFGNNTTVGETGATLTKETNYKTLSAKNMADAGAVMKIGAYVAGDYTFSYNKSTKVLTVTWPSINQLQVYTAEPAHAAAVSNWNWDSNAGTTYTKTLSLNANTRYKFKVVFNSDFYGFKTGSPASGDNNYDNPMTTSNSDNWRLYTDGGDSYLTTTQAGNYVFTFNSNDGGNKKLSVAFPPDVYLEANEQSIYKDASTTLRADAWHVTSGKSIKYEFFKGTTLTDANKISTQNLTTSSTTHSTTLSVTPSFNGTDAGSTTTSQVYTVRMTFNGQTATYTTTVYRKWDIYVHDTEDWRYMYLYYYNSDGSHAADYPGNECPKYNGSDSWYKVTFDAKYSYFLLSNGADTKKTFDNQNMNIATFAPDTYWYTAFDNTGGDGKNYYTLGTITITAPIIEFTATPISSTVLQLHAYVSNTGGDGLTAEALKATGFKVGGDEVIPDCYSGGNFYKVITGLTPGATYSVQAYATNILHTTTTPSPAQSVTMPSAERISIRVKNEMNWYGVYIIAYSDTEDPCGSYSSYNVRDTIEMTELGYDKWFYASVPNYYRKFMVSELTMASNAVDLVSDCYTNKKGGVNDKLGTITCPTLNIYQVEVVVAPDSVYHSNTVTNIADTLSFYSRKGAVTNLVYFNGSSVKRTNISSSFSSYTEGDVFVAKVASAAGTSLTGIARYTGDFYIRTDGAAGGWNDYIRVENTFSQFEMNKTLYPNDYYNHYWCAYLSAGVNVKAQLANKYNKHLSTTLPDFNLPTQSSNPAYSGTNVRFAYNNKNNFFERKFIRAAEGDFLQVYGFAPDGHNEYVYVYTNKNCTTQVLYGSPKTFSDLSDWQYQVDFYVKVPSTPATGNALHASQICVISNYYYADYTHAATLVNLGGSDENVQYPFEVTGTTTTPNTYLIRAIYDFKLNRIIAAWLPNDDKLFSGTLDAKMMITRNNDDDAKTIGIPDGNRTLNSVHRIYGVLEIDRDVYLGSTKKGSGNVFYWVSLPFDVYVKDVFGIDNYGTKWTIQRYRGDLRATNGYYEGHTFWRNMNNLSATAKMEKNRGYVIYVNLENSDFKEIKYYLANGTETTKSAKRLYFPSANADGTDFTLSYSTSATIKSTFPSNVSSLPGRRNQDSNWWVAGVPGYNNATISSPTVLAGDAPALDSLPGGSLRYCYQYEWGHADKKDNYVPKTVAQMTFKPFYSYMFQYAGDVTWSREISTNLAAMPARRDLLAKRVQQETMLQINLYDDIDNLDHTYVTFSDDVSITPEFDLNSDLTKIMNSGSQIYSLAGNDLLAGNVVPYTQDTVPLGVVIREEGTYTFNLENSADDMTVYLYDRQTGNRTCLTYNDYDVTLPAGTYDRRFYIETARKPSVATDMENTDGTMLNVSLRDGMLYIEGISDGSYMRLYDMTGRLIIATTYNTGTGIQSPIAGLYLLTADNATHKIVVK